MLNNIYLTRRYRLECGWLLVALVLFCLVAGGVVGTATGADHQVDVALSEVATPPGEPAVVELSIHGAGTDEVPVSGFEIVITFDPDVIAFEGMAGEEYVDPVINDDDADEGTVHFIAVDGSGPETPFAPAVVIEFTAVGDPGEASTVAIDAERSEVAGPGGDGYVAAFADGAVTIDEDATAHPPIGDPADDDGDAETTEGEQTGDDVATPTPTPTMAPTDPTPATGNDGDETDTPSPTPAPATPTPAITGEDDPEPIPGFGFAVAVFAFAAICAWRLRVE